MNNYITMSLIRQLLDLTGFVALVLTSLLRSVSANKVVGIEPPKHGTRGATDEAQTTDWLKVFDKAYKGISAAIST